MLYYVFFSESFKFPNDAADDLERIICLLKAEQYDNRNSMPYWYIEKHGLSSMEEEEYQEFIDSNDYSYIDEIIFSRDKHNGIVHVESKSTSSHPFAWILSEVMEHHGIDDPLMLQEAHITIDDNKEVNEAGAGEAVGFVFVIGLDRDGHGVVQSCSTFSMGDDMIAEMKQQREQSQGMSCK